MNYLSTFSDFPLSGLKRGEAHLGSVGGECYNARKGKWRLVYVHTHTPTYVHHVLSRVSSPESAVCSVRQSHRQCNVTTVLSSRPIREKNLWHNHIYGEALIVCYTRASNLPSACPS